jgi:RNA polymerase primary sigma factor
MPNNTIARSPERGLTASSGQAVNDQFILEHMPEWLVRQAGVAPIEGDTPLKPTPDGAVLIGKALLSVAETYVDTSTTTARTAQRIVEVILADGVDAARRQYKTADTAWLASRVRQFGDMVQVAGEEVGGAEVLRGMVLTRLAKARDISLSGADRADALQGLFVPAPVPESPPAPSTARTRRTKPAPATAPRAARTIPRKRTTVATSAKPIREGSDTDEPGDNLEVVDDEAVAHAVGELEAELGRKAQQAAGDEPDLAHLYLKGIGQFPLLTAEQEVDLSKRIEAGLYAEKILEVAALMRTGELPAEDRQLLVMATYYGMDKHGRKKDAVFDEATAKLNPERLRSAEERVDGLVEHVERRLHSGDKGYALGTEESDDLEIVVTEGIAAKQVMIESNLRLVVYWAKHYRGKHLKQLDLYQEGNIGLIRAVEKFDYTKENKFSTYATWWIKQNIKRALADKDREIRTPVHVYEDIGKLIRVQNDIQRETGYPASPEQIAEAMGGIDVEKVNQLIKLSMATISLDQTLGGDDDRTLYDLIGDREETAQDTDATATDLAHIAGVRELLPDLLDGDEVRLACALFGFDDTPILSVSELAKRLHTTNLSIRNTKTKILLKLLHPSSPTRPLITRAFGAVHDMLSETETVCKSIPTREYFPTTDRDDTVSRRCGGCALQAACAVEGMQLGRRIGTKRQHQFGVWGGTNESQRSNIANLDVGPDGSTDYEPQEYADVAV